MTEGTARTLHGRADEQRRLGSALDDALEGRKRGAILIGAAGAGKTTLLRRAAEQAKDRGMLPVRVRIPGGVPLPARSPISEIVAILGEAAAADPASAHEALARALREAGKQHRVALLIDDLHWAPAEGSAILLSALRSIEQPMAVIATMRAPDAADQNVTQIPESTGDLPLDIIDVAPLDEAALGAIVHDMLGGPALPSLVRALHDETQGNALHVVEALRDARAEGWIEHTAGYWSMREGFRPRAMLESIRARLRRLPEPARRVAGILAIIGRPAPFGEIAATLPATETSEIVDSLDALAAAGFAGTDDSGRYRMLHPLHRTAIIDLMGTARRAAAHDAVLSMLRRGESPPAELAHHAARGSSPPPDLPDLLRAAGTDAEAHGSPAAAAAWFQALVDLLPEGSDDASAALEALARTTAQVDPAAAVQRYTQALEGTGGAERARLLTSRARARQRAGRFEEALGDLSEALPLASGDDTFAIEAGMGVLGLLTGDVASAQKRLTSLAERSRGTGNHARAVYHLAALRLFAGDVQQFGSLSREAMTAASDIHLKRSALNNVAWALMLDGRLPDAEDLLIPAIREAEAAGDRGGLFPMLANAALLQAWKGNIAAALDWALRSLTHARAIGNHTDVATALMCMIVPLLEAGTPAQARASVDELDAVLAKTTELRELGLVYLVLGDAHLALGDIDTARDRCERAAAFLDLDSVIWSEGVARLRGAIHLAEGEHARAAEAVAPWIERPGVVALEHAKALQIAGIAGFRTRDRERGRALVETAAGLFADMGAQVRADDARRWLAGHPIRKPGRRPSTLPAGLTQREVEILDLVVRGKSNREIAESLTVSPATVKTHVERILAKTGAGRRGELAHVAKRLGVLQETDYPDSIDPIR